MRNRHALVFLLGLFASFLFPLGAAEKDPFASKFGGPHKEGISMKFRMALVEYAGGMRNAYAVLGIAGLTDQEAFKGFCKDFIDPALAKLDPKTDAEKKMKAAAINVKDSESFLADPASIPEDQHKALGGFLDSCILPGEASTESTKVQGMLMRFSAYCMGMSLEECMEAMKKAKQPGK